MHSIVCSRVEWSQLSVTQRSGRLQKEGSICVTREEWIGIHQVARREGRWKSACPEGQFTSTVWGHPTSWSMIGIFFAAAWQMEHTLSLVNYYSQRSSVGMPWLTTNGWDHMYTWYSDQMQNECSEFGGEGSKGFQMLEARPGLQECLTSVPSCYSEAPASGRSPAWGWGKLAPILWLTSCLLSAFPSVSASSSIHSSYHLLRTSKSPLLC